MTATSTLLWNTLLAFFWALATGDLTITSLITGFIIGFIVLFVGRRVIGSQDYSNKAVKLLRLLAFFLWDLVVANLRVAYDIVTPTHHMKPSVLAIPLDCETDGEITALANMITLTPGTLALDVSADRKTLYIHSTYTPDAAEMRRSIKEGVEKRILEVTR
jgi:multicomponent Na+:H+ antiporter subunit E